MRLRQQAEPRGRQEISKVSHDPLTKRVTTQATRKPRGPTYYPISALTVDHCPVLFPIGPIRLRGGEVIAAAEVPGFRKTHAQRARQRARGLPRQAGRRLDRGPAIHLQPTLFRPANLERYPNSLPVSATLTGDVRWQSEHPQPVEPDEREETWRGRQPSTAGQGKSPSGRRRCASCGPGRRSGSPTSTGRAWAGRRGIGRGEHSRRRRSNSWVGSPHAATSPTGRGDGLARAVAQPRPSASDRAAISRLLIPADRQAAEEGHDGCVSKRVGAHHIPARHHRVDQRSPTAIGEVRRDDSWSQAAAHANR